MPNRFAEIYMNGILLSCVGTLASAAGTFLVPTRPWIGNALIVGVGSSCEILANFFTSSMTLAPLASLVVFWSLVIGPWFDGGGPGAGSSTGATRIAPYPRNPRNLACCLGIFLGSAWIALFFRAAASRDFDDRAAVHALNILFAAGAAAAAAVGISLKYHKPAPPWDSVAPGVLGGFTNLALKSAMAAHGTNHPAFLAFLILAIEFAMAQLAALNLALLRRDPVRTNALYVATLIVSVIACAALREGRIPEPLFFVGVLAVVLGATGMQPPPPKVDESIL